MAYVSALRVADQVFVWERNDDGRKMVTYPSPYYLYVKDPTGEYKSIYGDALARYDDFENGKHFNAVRRQLKDKGLELFESDIPPELKVLSHEYYGKPTPKIHTTFLDIEVDYSTALGFSSIDNPYAEINAISMYHQWLNKYVVFALIPDDANCRVPSIGDASDEFITAMNDISPINNGEDHELVIKFFVNERQLLTAMLHEIEDSDVLSGWNSALFDIPYIVKRLELIGKRFAKQMCFPEAKAPTWREVNNGYGQEVSTVDIYGRCSVDYMELFRKYEVAERPSYKLESIADEILPEMPKLHYSGTLADLYRNDFERFMRYNIRDTEILKGFEDRLGYIALANEMIHMSTGEFKHVCGTLKLAELATINYCHHKLNNMIVNDMRHSDDVGGQIQGALVLVPQVGMHKNVGSIDISSLYPACIRAINISPETIIGQFTMTCTPITTVTDNTVLSLPVTSGATYHINQRTLTELTLEFEDGTTQTATGDEWHDILTENKWSISGYGTVFNQTTLGIIPTVLQDWYSSRKQYQGMKQQAIEDGDDEKIAYYDRLQYTYKIKLNSYYGALSNQYFRFYDTRMGESVTATGRSVLLHQCAQTVLMLDGTYQPPDSKTIVNNNGIDYQHWGYSDKWSVIYSDTDSAYFKTHTDTTDDAILVADAIGDRVNASYPDFMQSSFLCTEAYKDLIKTGREIVSDNGIFVDKKRYILHIVDNEGQTVDKMKVMGLETKKTTMPKAIAERINGFVERYLKGEQWADVADSIVAYKDELMSTDDVMSIGLPKGIKRVEHYTEQLQIYGAGARLPGHIAASIFYNQCLEQFSDTTSMKIVSGMKIKVFYLAEPVGRFKSIAIPVDIETVPQWFMDNFDIDMDAHLVRLIDGPLDNIIKAVGLRSPSRQTQFVENVLEF